MQTARRALVSVSDKEGLEAFARGLVDQGFEIVSSGGTAKVLEGAGIAVTPVAEVTGFPEMLGGRVKTLHPLIHGGILGDPDNPEHAQQMKEHGIRRFDLVAVNLYPFEEGLGRNGATDADQIELIDIGGPALVRAAAKNHAHVTVVVDPSDYPAVLAHLKEGNPPARELRRLAAKAFQHTARYDALIARWLESTADVAEPGDRLVLALDRGQRLRYGENHHQAASFYREPTGLLGSDPSMATCRQLHGKSLSYNNILDGDTALDTLKEFTEPTVVIIKHATPSGIASADDLVKAWKDAYATDTYSPFGGIVAVNGPVNQALAQELSKVFLELVLAPSFEKPAVEVLSRKKNLRLLEVPGLGKDTPRRGLTLRAVTGGVLVQDRDVMPFDVQRWKTVTRRRPTDEELEGLAFAAKCTKHVRSNAVVFAKGTRTVGIGGGQTARVDAVYIATKKGGDNIRGSVLASDAFFPFRDTVDAAAKAGVTAIVQPGGSVKDAEVIAAADEHGIAMVFSGQRSFRH